MVAGLYITLVLTSARKLTGWCLDISSYAVLVFVI